MEAKTIGFIGAGNMAHAIAQGFISSKLVLPENIIVSARTNARLSTVWTKMGTMTSTKNIDVVTKADIIFLCVKPHILPGVLVEISNDAFNTWSDKVFISVAAGVTVEFVEEKLSKVPNVKVIKAGVNTPCQVQSGVIVYTLGKNCSEKEDIMMHSLMSSVGHVEQVDGSHRSAMGSLTGCSIAWFYTVIEEMSDGGVKSGVPRDVSYRLASKAMEGAAKMVLKSGKHVGQLKDEATSPDGSTIAGIYELEQAGVRGIFMRAVQAATERNKELGKQ